MDRLTLTAMIATTPAFVPGIVPVENALAAVRRRRGPEVTRGLVPGLLVVDATRGWLSAGSLTGSRLDELLDAAKQRWGASPHVAAALAWRSYTYWLAMPVVLGWAVSRRVLLLDPDDVLLRISGTHDQPLVTFGLRRVRLAGLAGDRLAADATAASEAELLGVLRRSLREHHLDPLLERLRARVNLGARTMLGSLASAVAYGVVRGIDAPAAELTATAGTLLSALDVADLVDLQPGPDGLEVRRRTCCLAFTLPEPKICSGCCLQPPPS
jgi:hypothetical protein